MRVLVVEDEERFAAGLRDGLEAEGFAVDVALDGVDGLWLARENAYDAIVLDIMLPRLNGYRVCRALRGAGDCTRRGGAGGGRGAVRGDVAFGRAIAPRASGKGGTERSVRSVQPLFSGAAGRCPA